jgi:hypothetical protein
MSAQLADAAEGGYTTDEMMTVAASRDLKARTAASRKVAAE